MTILERIDGGLSDFQITKHERNTYLTANTKLGFFPHFTNHKEIRTMKTSKTSYTHFLITLVLIGAVLLTACHSSKAKNDANVPDVIITGDVALDAEHFPDNGFRKYITHFDTDNNGILSADERGKVFEINLHEDEILTSEEIWEINSLEGLQYFPLLSRLDCSGAELNALDVRALTDLTYLNCSMTNLHELDVSRNQNLRRLYCNVNHLSSIDLTNNTKLTHFHCVGNELSSLDVSNCPHLIELDFSQNALTTIDLESNHELQHLACVCNSLKTVSMPHSTLLHYADLTANEGLAEIDVSNNPILIGLLKRGTHKGDHTNTCELLSNGSMFLQTDNTVDVYWAVG